jgi:predicted nucleic acid-binding protein
VPELAFVEVANALVVYSRSGAIGAEGARASLGTLLALPLAVVSLQELVEAALEVAQASGLSVYDACYAALAEASHAVLVTADNGLAAAVPRSVLLPDAGPPG